MIKIVIVSHAGIAEGLVSGIELIMGKVPGLLAFGLTGADSFETFSRNINRELEATYCDDGVLILVDLFGGTPCNVSAINIQHGIEASNKGAKRRNIECISGVNLPMVVGAIAMRDMIGLSQLKDYCIDAGLSGIKDIRVEFNLTEIG